MKPSDEIRQLLATQLHVCTFEQAILLWLDEHWPPQPDPHQDAEAKRLVRALENSTRAHCSAEIRENRIDAFNYGKARDSSRAALLTYIAGLWARLVQVNRLGGTQCPRPTAHGPSTGHPLSPTHPRNRPLLRPRCPQNRRRR